MMTDSDQVYEPGSIIYIPDTVSAALYAQGVDTYSLTGLPLDVAPAPVMHNDMMTYVARVKYDNRTFYFRDYGCGMTAGSNTRRPESHWWIEPVNKESMETSYLGIKPVINDTSSVVDCYWATMCCDFPIFIPEGSGVEGAYTIREVVLGSDSIYYAEPIKVYGQGEIVPAATPVLFKCFSAYASGNKVVPTGDIANHTAMPIANDMLMGNYFSSFVNHASMTDYSLTKVYVPKQATLASPTYLALGIDADGYPTFQPKEDGTYMDSNSAWLDITGLEASKGTFAVRLGTPPVDEEPQEPEEPEEPQTLVGDIDGNGVVDVDDVVAVISKVLNQDGDISAYDVNGDGSVDIDDVASIINAVLNIVKE